MPKLGKHFGAPTHADIELWRELLTNIDYKPGWRFILDDTTVYRTGRLVVRVEMLVWDTFEDRDLKPLMVTTNAEIEHTLFASNAMNGTSWVHQATKWLRDLLHRIEQHEADEWFRFHGCQLYNPHGKSQHLGRRPEGWGWMGPPEIAIAPSLLRTLLTDRMGDT